MRDRYLRSSNWQFGWKQHERPLGLRVGLGPLYACDARDLIEFMRRYGNDGTTAQIVQVTDLAEALLDPGITLLEPVPETSTDEDAPVVGKKVESFLVDELKLMPVPPHHCIAENPGYLGRESVNDQLGLEFYYYEY